MKLGIYVLGLWALLVSACGDGDGSSSATVVVNNIPITFEDASVGDQYISHLMYWEIRNLSMVSAMRQQLHSPYTMKPLVL